jgi:two-component system CheB/CheR fusion protein
MSVSTPPDTPQFEEFLQRLKNGRGFDFTAYKRPTLRRRVAKRMSEVGVGDHEQYADILEADAAEAQALFNTILINVTRFFRDPAAWQALECEVIASIAANHRPGEPVRVWCAGCASGEEAYTVAILLAEALGVESFRDDVKIYATDVDDEAIAAARHAVYPQRAMSDVPPELVERYFVRQGGDYAFRKDLRRCLIFGRHDLLADAPISHVDLLVCRNTLMYFNSEGQRRILARFYFSLRDDGYIFLGKAEMLLAHAEQFAPVNLKWRIFTKTAAPGVRGRFLRMSQQDHPADNVPGGARLQEAALESDPAAQLVVDVDGRLIVANRQARTLFNIAAADIDKAIQDVEVSYRPIKLRSLIERARSSREPARVTDVPWTPADGEPRWLDIQAYSLRDPAGRELGVKIVFSDITSSRRLQQELEASRSDLETSLQELQSTNEELETTNEELQSTVEELETTNEELQSTNEELETMNEELQSTNEELETVNDEMRQRTEEFNRANLFLDSILSNLEIGALVLDREQAVQIWNARMEDMWGVRADEARGRNLFQVDIGLPLSELQAPISRAIEGNEPGGLELPARNRRGRDIRCRVIIRPLVTQASDIGGVVVLMEEVPPAGQPG